MGILFSLGKSHILYWPSLCKPISEKTSSEARSSLNPNVLTNEYFCNCLTKSACIAGASVWLQGCASANASLRSRLHCEPSLSQFWKTLCYLFCFFRALCVLGRSCCFVEDALRRLVAIKFWSCCGALIMPPDI